MPLTDEELRVLAEVNSVGTVISRKHGRDIA